MCLPLQMPEMLSMGPMLCLRGAGVGNCQGMVPGLCVFELQVTQAAQPHVRALEPSAMQTLCRLRQLQGKLPPCSCRCV